MDELAQNVAIEIKKEFQLLKSKSNRRVISSPASSMMSGQCCFRAIYTAGLEPLGQQMGLRRSHLWCDDMLKLQPEAGSNLIQ